MLLHRHLYVEHSLRVRTDDDEVELAYFFFFFDDEVVAKAPHRLAYLVHESWPLPDQVGQPGGRHLAQLSMHCSDVFGYQQWYLFDTLWAATHPNLAQSLLRYAHHWDPLDD
ncbi:hypothetical protein GCM10027199_77830 [Amycolatopsis magusensis]